MITVWYITTHSIEPFGYNLFTWSSLETHPHKYCKIVKKLGYRPILGYLTLSHKRSVRTTHKYMYPMIAYPVSIGHGHFNYEISIKLCKDIIRYSKCVNIIHVHNYYSIMFDLIVLLLSIKAFLTRHKTPVVAQYHGGDPWLLLFPFRFFKKITMRLADKFIVANKAEIKRLMRYYKVPLNKIAYVHDGVDTNFFRPLKNVNKESQTMLFVGNLFKEKGIFALIPILKRCRQKFNARLYIVGDGPFKSLLERKITEYNLKESIILIGRVNWDQLLLLYNKAMVTILPSEREGFPLALVESMSCGTPVVATITDGSKEIITDEVDGFLIPQDDVESFAEAVCQLLSNATIYEQMSINARKKAVSKFSLERLGEKLHRVYHSCL